MEQLVIGLVKYLIICSHAETRWTINMADKRLFWADDAWQFVNPKCSKVGKLEKKTATNDKNYALKQCHSVEVSSRFVNRMLTPRGNSGQAIEVFFAQFFMVSMYSNPKTFLFWVCHEKS